VIPPRRLDELETSVLGYSRLCGHGRRRVSRAPRGLDELDRVAGWVVDQDLLAARAGDDLVPEAKPRCPEALGLDVVDDEWMRFQPLG